MRFRQAVSAVADIRAAYSAGLGALRPADKRRVQCANPNRLAGSVNLELALRAARPNEPLWDYALGWNAADETEQAIWVEVHPANSQHVDDVIRKKRWLDGWLRDKGQPLRQITRPQDGFVWLASRSVSLLRDSPQARKLAQSGVSFPRPRLVL
jgi:hypothetical protein